ncbi:hypothetical protein E4T61_19310 [Bacillus velezensis]|nr:hypothetical protein E4T61_19310 [Bacillus velezensis]
MLSTVLSLKNIQTPFYHFSRKRIEKHHFPCICQTAAACFTIPNAGKQINKSKPGGKKNENICSNTQY